MRLARLALRLTLLLATVFVIIPYLALLKGLGFSPHRRRLALSPILKGLLWGLGIKAHHNIKKPPLRGLFIANHLSYLDIIILQALLPLSFLGKSEIKSWPIFSQLAYLLKHRYVDREDPVARGQLIFQLAPIIKEEALLIFPEGTTSMAPSPPRTSWQRGQAVLAKRARAPMHAIGLAYTPHEEVCWVDDDQLVPHLLKLLQCSKIHVYIHLQEIPHPLMTQVKGEALVDLTHAQVVGAVESAKKLPELSQSFRSPQALEIPVN